MYKPAPPLNILGIYLDNGPTNEETKIAHEKIVNKVKERWGEECIIMGDLNYAINEAFSLEVSMENSALTFLWT